MQVYKKDHDPDNSNGVPHLESLTSWNSKDDSTKMSPAEN